MFPLRWATSPPPPCPISPGAPDRSPVARAPARAGACAMRGVGMLTLDFTPPMYLIGVPSHGRQPVRGGACHAQRRDAHPGLHSPGVPDQRPVARVQPMRGARAMRGVGMLSPDFFPVYPVGAPVAWAIAHAGGACCLSCPLGRWPGGSQAPLFRLSGHGEGGGFAAAGGRRRRPRYGHPSAARASGQGDGRMRQHTPPLDAQ